MFSLRDNFPHMIFSPKSNCHAKQISKILPQDNFSVTELGKLDCPFLGHTLVSSKPWEFLVMHERGYACSCH